MWTVAMLSPPPQHAHSEYLAARSGYQVVAVGANQSTPHPVHGRCPGGISLSGPRRPTSPTAGPNHLVCDLVAAAAGLVLPVAHDRLTPRHSAARDAGLPNPLTP
jgi:hypothetical protein